MVERYHLVVVGGNLRGMAGDGGWWREIAGGGEVAGTCVRRQRRWKVLP